VKPSSIREPTQSTKAALSGASPPKRSASSSGSKNSASSSGEVITFGRES